MYLKRIRSEAGDTIVEVLIVLAILGLAFGIASATTTHAINQARNAQEHSQAMGMLSSQLELLRRATSEQQNLPDAAGGLYCLQLQGDGSIRVVTGSPSKDNVKPECLQSSYYNMSISTIGDPNLPTGYYTLRVRWQGVSGDLGTQQEVYYYRIHPLSQSVI